MPVSQLRVRDWASLRRGMRLVPFFAGAMMVSACGPSLTQVRTFGVATESVSRDTRNCFALIDSSVITRKTYEVASSTFAFPVPATFKGFFESDDVSAKALKVRLDLLDNLGAYGAALQDLATADVKADVDSASTELFGAVQNMEDTYTQVSGKPGLISAQRLGVISSAVAGLGGAISDRKRRAALRTIIDATDDSVQRAAELIADDLAPKPASETGSDLGHFVEENLRMAFGSLQDAYLSERGARGATFDSRLRLLRQMQTIHERKAAVRSLFASVAASAREMVTAHHELKLATASRSFTSDQAAAAISRLAGDAHQVRALYAQWQQGD